MKAVAFQISAGYDIAEILLIKAYSTHLLPGATISMRLDPNSAKKNYFSGKVA
jgi:hypothetical protein